MNKDTSASRAFLSSLVLLVVALAVFLLVMAPWRHPEPRITAHEDGSVPTADATRQSLRSTRPRHVAPPEPSAPPSAKGGEAAGPAAAEAGEDPDIQRAINQIDAGDTTGAVTSLEGVLKRDPKNEQALVEMAMIYLLDLKQPDQATTYLQRVIDVNPGNQIVMSELISLYEEQGKLDDGVAFLTEAQAKTPASADIAYGIGQLMTMEGRDSDAISYLEKAAQSPDNAVKAYKDLGEAYARSGDPERALDSYAKAVSGQEKEIAEKQSKGLPVQYIQERLSYTKMDMARACLLKGDVDQAQQLLNDVKTVMPGDESVTALQATINKRKAG